MALSFRDFVPEQRASQRRVIAADGSYTYAHMTESMAALVQRASSSLAAHGLRPLSVETLILPSVAAAALAEHAVQVHGV